MARNFHVEHVASMKTDAVVTVTAERGQGPHAGTYFVRRFGTLLGTIRRDTSRPRRREWVLFEPNSETEFATAPTLGGALTAFGRRVLSQRES